MFVQTIAYLTATMLRSLHQESNPKNISFTQLSSPDYVPELLDRSELVEGRFIQPLLCYMVQHGGFEVIFLRTALKVRDQCRILVLFVHHVKV